MKISTVVFILWFITLPVCAQTYQWAKTTGSTRSDIGWGVAVDNNGNVYTTGYFSETMDADPGSGVTILTHHAAYDIYVSKFDKNGNFLWAKNVGSNASSGGADDYPVDIFVTKDGGVVVFGRFSTTIDFDPGPSTYNVSSYGFTDVFMWKLSASGDFQWVKHFGPSSDNKAPGNQTVDITGVKRDKNNNFYLYGVFDGKVDFDLGTGTYILDSGQEWPKFSQDGYVSKLTEIGDFVWAYQIGDNSDTYSSKVSDVAVDTSGNVFSTGQFTGLVDFDPSTNTYNIKGHKYGHSFIQKVDKNKNFEWADFVGDTTGNGLIFGTVLAAEENGSITIAGVLKDSADLDPGNGIYKVIQVDRNQGNSEDVFFMQLNTQGVFKWARVLRSTYKDDYPIAMTYDKNNILFFAGNFFGTIYFNEDPEDPNRSINAYQDVLFLKLRGQGDILMRAVAGGPDAQDYSSSLFVDSDRNVYMCGSFAGTTSDYDPSSNTDTKSNVGGQYTDIFQLKWATCGAPTTSTKNVTACDSYTSPSGKYVYKQSGIYKDTIANAIGCDSVMTLNLTIKKSTSSTQTISVCNSYTWNGETYTSSGTYTKTIQNNVGCDSLMTLELIISVVNNKATVNGNKIIAEQSNAIYQWYDCSNKQVIPGETNQNFEPTASGEYAVIVSQSSCKDTSDCITFTKTGILEQDSIELSVYPNPIQSEVTIKVSKRLQNGVIQLYDLGGRLFLEKTNQSGQEFTLFLGHLAVGSYILQVKDEKMIAVISITK